MMLTSLLWLLIGASGISSDPLPITNWEISNATLPYALYEMGCTTYNKSIYIFGGKTDAKDVRNQVLAYSGNQWDIVDYLPANLICSNTPAIRIKSKVYFVGCRLYNTSEPGTFFMYDIDTKTVNNSITTIPKNVYSNCIVTNNDQTKIYVIGGYSNSLQNYVPWLQVYDIQRNEWNVRVSSMNYPRGWFACSYSDTLNSIFVFGGHDNDNHLSTIEQYDISKDKWIINDVKLNQNISDASAITVNDTIYIVGGETDPDNELNTVLQFDIQSNKLCVNCNANLTRNAADVCFVEMNNSLWVIAGWPASDIAMISSKIE